VAVELGPDEPDDFDQLRADEIGLREWYEKLSEDPAYGEWLTNIEHTREDDYDEIPSENESGF
jgi:hypothetical protein